VLGSRHQRMEQAHLTGYQPALVLGTAAAMERVRRPWDVLIALGRSGGSEQGCATGIITCWMMTLCDVERQEMRWKTDHVLQDGW
jgi:hypothetical protein